MRITSPNLLLCSVLLAAAPTVAPAQSKRLEKILEELVTRLGDRTRAGESYARLLAIGTPAVPLLVEAVRGTDGKRAFRWRRARALRLLGDMGPRAKTALRPLLERTRYLRGPDRELCVVTIARLAPFADMLKNDVARGTSISANELVVERVRLGPKPTPEAIDAALASRTEARRLAALQVLADGLRPDYEDTGKVGVLFLRLYRRRARLSGWKLEIAAGAGARFARQESTRVLASACLLDHPDPAVNWRAIKTIVPLAKTHGLELASHLVRCLGYSTPEVQKKILSCLPDTAAHAWRALYDVAVFAQSDDPAFRSLATRAREALAAVVDTLVQGNDAEAMSFVFSWVRDENGPLVRRSLAWMLQNPSGGHPILPDIRRLTRSEDQSIRDTAAKVLAAVDAAFERKLRGEGRAAAIPVERFVNHWPEVTAADTAAAVGPLREDPAPLIECVAGLQGRGWSARRVCGLFALVGRVGKPAARAAGDIVDWTSSGDRGVASAAYRCLTALGPAVAAHREDYRIDLVRHVETGHVDELTNCLAHIEVHEALDTPTLTRLIAADNPSVRLRALRFLHKRKLDPAKDTSTLDALREAVAEDHPVGLPKVKRGATDYTLTIRAAAAAILRPLARTKDERLVCAVGLFEGGDAAARRNACPLFAELKKARLVEVLHGNILRHEKPIVLDTLALIQKLAPDSTMIRIDVESLTRSGDEDIAAGAAQTLRILQKR